MRGISPNRKIRKPILPKAERDSLVLENRGIAGLYAGKFAAKHPHLQYDDLFQEGILGLMRAAEKFDPSRGVKFATFAAWDVADAMLHVRDRNTSMVSGMAQRSNIRRNPEVEAIRKRAFGRPIRLEVCPKGKGDGDGSLPLRERLRSLGADPETAATASERLRVARHLLHSLPPKERDILRRWMLGETAESIGRDYGVTKARIDQIQKKAISKLCDDPWVVKTKLTGGI